MAGPVLVVGAGPSGLAVTRALRDAGHTVEGVERHADVGGIWDIDNPGTPMYSSAHFISSKWHSVLGGHPFPDDYPDYPRHDLLLAYLRSFADAHDLRASYRFGTSLEALQPRDGSGWTATFSDGTHGAYEAVVLGVGNQWHENLPDYPGTWEGEAIHSRRYRSRDELRGKRVLIVGAGNSGCDIACDAAEAADFAAISMRRGYKFVPKYVFGKPADVFAAESPSLPGALQQRTFDLLLDRVVGDVTRFGLPKPDHRALASHPIMNTTILDKLGHGDLAPRPDIAALDGHTVRFVDGREETYDLIIWATGYRPLFPMLPDGVLTWHAWNPGLFLNLFHRERDDLFIMGMVETDGSAWPHITLQADLIATWLSVLERDPAQAQAFRRLRHTDADLLGGVEHIDSPRHSYYQRNATYVALATECLRQLRDGAVTGEPLAVGAAGAARRVLGRLREALP